LDGAHFDFFNQPAGGQRPGDGRENRREQQTGAFFKP
jgi:hypothetical protein